MQMHDAPFARPAPQYKGAPAEWLFAQVETDDGNIAQVLFLQVFYIDRQVRHSRSLQARHELGKGGAHGSFATEPLALMFSRKECRRILDPPCHHLIESKVRESVEKAF